MQPKASGKMALAFQGRCESLIDVRDGMVWPHVEDAREEARRMASEASEETGCKARWDVIRVLAKGQRVVSDERVIESGVCQ